MIRAGELSSRELVETYLARIDALDPDLNAFRVVFGERALAEADQADGRRAAGQERPLLGVPVAIKDGWDVAGELSTQGSRAQDTPAIEDAEFVKRLRAAGCVLIGKTTQPELAAFGFTETQAFGKTRNPWNLEHTPGGSSGGSAAAVAAGLVGIASASDGAGSIRIPASCTNLFGLKPQRGRVSMMPLSEHWFGMSVAGCVSRTVLDSALYYDAVMGGAPGDAHSAPPPARPWAEAARAAAPGKLRIAVATNVPVLATVTDDGLAGVNRIADALRGLGHQVFETKLAYGPAFFVGAPRYFAGIARDAETLIAHPELLEARTRQLAKIGSMIPRSLLEFVMRREAQMRERIGRVFERCDVVLTPVMTKPPPRVGKWDGRSGIVTINGNVMQYPFPMIWNMTGQPAAAVPGGFSSGGLPVGGQLVGRTNDEDTLISLSAQLEAELGWPQQTPPEHQSII